MQGRDFAFAERRKIKNDGTHGTHGTRPMDSVCQCVVATLKFIAHMTHKGLTMAGTKKKRSDLELLDAIDPELITGMLEHGKSIADVCLALGISKRALDIWIDQTGFSESILRARVRAADLMACQTLAIADAIPDDNPSRPLHRIRTRQWLAERWDPKLYGTKQTEVSINIGSLRLDALRQIEVSTNLDADTV